jgi:DNA (cytosine-5)-methyltransferase 1
VVNNETIYNEIDDYAVHWLRALISEGHVAPGRVERTGIEHLRPEHVANAKQVHFFAGIGVWSHALRLAEWPDDRPVWTGSCPCQPFSQAGSARGSSDARHLWPAWFALIRECRPPVIFGEQVASKSGRYWLDAVSADLETLGYAVGAADLCAAGVGAPHIRQRLFWVAYADGDANQQYAGELPGDEVQHVERGPHCNYTPQPNGKDNAWSVADWMPCDDGLRRPFESGTPPLVDGAPEVLGRLRGYGNAIVAPLAAQFIRSVMGLTS